MPMNEYGEIIRNSSPPPPIPPHRNSDPNRHYGCLIGIIISIVIIAVIITGLKATQNNPHNSDNENSQLVETNTNSIEDNQTEISEERNGIIVETLNDIAIQHISNFKNHINNIVSSSHLATETYGNKTYIYSVEKAFDNDMSTCWSEGADGHGVGESITISFDDVYEITELSLWNGLCTSEDLFYKNSRLHNITVILSDGNSYDFECSDGWNNRNNTFSFGKNIETSSLTIIIQSVYEGNKYKDTCISEISVS